jgi:hypothetical protein
MSPVIRQKPREQTRQASSTWLSAEPAYGNDHHDVGEAINGKAFDGSSGSLDGSRNRWRAGRRLSGANGHDHRSVRSRRAGRYHRQDRRRHFQYCGPSFETATS